MDSHIPASIGTGIVNGAMSATNGNSNANANAKGSAHHFKSEDDARETNQLQMSPTSDTSSSRQPRRRNKPSLSCESCTVACSLSRR